MLYSKAKMNKKYVLSSLYKIANTLDVSGLHKEATSLTNVMKRLAQEETPQKINPLDLRDKDVSNLMDDELNKKQFMISIRKPVYEFVHLVSGLLTEAKDQREAPFSENASVWQTVMDMIANDSGPENYDASGNYLKVLNEIWKKYNELKKYHIMEAPIDEQLSSKYGIPTASDEQNKRYQEQVNSLRGMILLAMNQIMRSNYRMDAKYFSNADRINYQTEPAYTTKYSPEKPGQ